MMMVVVEAARGRGGRRQGCASDHSSGGEAKDEFADQGINSRG